MKEKVGRRMDELKCLKNSRDAGKRHRQQKKTTERQWTR